MSKVIEPSNVLSVSQVVEPGVGKDLLTEILRKGARELLAQAVEQEVQEWLSERSGLLDERGRNLVVRNGHLPERPSTREQRCWVHKTANVLNNLPKSIQPNAKLHEIWMAPTRAEAIKAFDLFLETYGAKYDKARDCLKKDRDELLTFYDFPAEHWKHLRTTNPIESTFATIRLRHRRTKGNGTRKATLTMLFKLAESASHHWRILDAATHLIEVANDTKFQDGIVLPKVAA